MKCLTCGKEAGKNRQGVSKVYCSPNCRKQGTKIVIKKRARYCVMCGRDGAIDGVCNRCLNF